MFCVFVNSSVLWMVGGVEKVNFLLFEEYEMLSKSFNLNIKEIYLLEYDNYYVE